MKQLNVGVKPKHSKMIEWIEQNCSVDGEPLKLSDWQKDFIISSKGNIPAGLPRKAFRRNIVIEE